MKVGRSTHFLCAQYKTLLNSVLHWQAFLSGKKFAEFHSRGQDSLFLQSQSCALRDSSTRCLKDYYVDFAKMLQRNKKTGRQDDVA